MPFISINKKLINKSEILGILNKLNKYPESIVSLKSSKNGEEYGLSRVYGCQDILQNVHNRLLKTILVPFECSIYAVKPNTEVKRHIDYRVEARSCSIITPIFPDNNQYASTLFFKDMLCFEPLAVLKYENLPALINTQIPHLVPKSTLLRINFQVHFGYSYETIKQRLSNNELFV